MILDIGSEKFGLPKEPLESELRLISKASIIYITEKEVKKIGYDKIIGLKKNECKLIII